MLLSKFGIHLNSNTSHVIIHLAVYSRFPFAIWNSNTSHVIIHPVPPRW